MTRLTPKQREMLECVEIDCGREPRVDPAFIPGHERARAAALVRRGLLENAYPCQTPSHVYITEAGRAALSAEPDHAG